MYNVLEMVIVPLQFDKYIFIVFHCIHKHCY